MKAIHRTSGFVILARLFWMMVGPAILMLLTITIVNRGSGWFTPHDFAFFIVLGAMMFARWYEFEDGNALTSTGEPALPTHLRKYLLGAMLVGLGVWVTANFVGNHWLAD